MHKRDAKPTKVLLGRVGHSLKMGIVGLPNVGKSSTFNLLSHLNVPAENFPFCTIEPNQAKVPIPDERFTKLCEKYKPKSKIPGTLTIFDIAGLVPNAHKGEGLGNAFLSNIQAVDGLFHMVRAFDNPEIVHTEGEIDPIRDLETIATELIFKDLDQCERRIADLQKIINRSGDDQSKKEIEVLLKVKALLDEKRWVKDEDWLPREIEYLNSNLFFTAKPVVYLINMSKENYETKKNKWLLKIKDWVEKRCPGIIIPFSVEYEQECEKNQGKGNSAMDKIIKTGYHVLNLIHFFTAGEDEVKCWTILSGTKAPGAAGTIHTDFEKGFICAEVMKYPELMELGSEHAVKAAGKYKQHGKEYQVEDGDIIFFKFNPPKSSKK
jgi:obg-like ATPase 1